MSTVTTPLPETFTTDNVAPLRRLGEVIPADASHNVLSAFEAAGLANWNVRKAPLFASDANTPKPIDVTDRWATVYDDPKSGETRYLGTVGSHYQPIQNEAHADILTAIVDESGAAIDSAGSLSGGRKTFLSMKVPQVMNVGGVDPVDLFLVAFNSHDGSSSFSFAITPVRVFCANQQAAVMKKAKSTFRIRHNGRSHGRIQEAREALGLTFAYMEEFEAEAEFMVGKSLTDKTFAKITARLFGAETATTERAEQTAAEHVKGVMELWRDSPTMQNLPDSRWKGYQAVTEYADHYMKIRNSGYHDAATARAVRSVTSLPTQRLKEMAFATLSRPVLLP
jgi:phage/plasmid-like protein (TIGR03299 family)